MLNLGIGLGLSGGAGGAGVVLGASQFYAPLTHSLILTRGTGDPTYTRATNAWEFDNEGKLILVPSGAARFGGARMVRNFLTSTEDLSAGVYTSTNITKTSNTLLRSSSAAAHITHAVSGTVNTVYTVSVKVKNKSTGNYFGLRLQGTYPNRADALFNLSTGVLVGSSGNTYVVNSSSISGPDVDGYYHLSLTALSVTSALAGVVFGPADSTSTVSGWEAGSAVLSDCYIKELQLENVTGQADQTASEYVSVGVLAAPYHGAGVDGVKWFDTNKDGSAISASSLLGYHAEGARTNSLLYSRDLTNAAWVKTNITPAKTATGVDNAANSASTLTASAADATILQTLSLAAAARSFSAYVKRRTGTGSVYITRDGGTNWTDITAQINSTTWTRVKIENTSVLNPSVGFKIATSGDAIDVDVCQDEGGAFISSPIITTTAAVTRNADVLSYPSTSNVADAAGSMLISWKLDDNSLSTYTQSRNLIGGTSGSVAFLYARSVNPTTKVATYDGANILESNVGTDVRLATTKVGATWSGATKKVTHQGLAVTSGPYDGAWIEANIGIGQQGNQPHAYMKNIYIWLTALTDAQLQQVTA